ncbi:MAG TPA: DUF5691 domain-containing protein [Stenomitos sp.]
MSQDWDTLTAAALLGTDRQATLPKITEDALALLLEQLDPTDVEGWLLSSAGLLRSFYQAGQSLPQQTRTLPDPSPTDLPIYAPEASLTYLKRMLAGEFRDALPEFLGCLQQSGQCVPPQYLAPLLDWGHQRSELRPLVKAIIGSRGHWLASQNPDWSYAIATPEAATAQDYLTLWETGDRHVRLNTLQAWRLADPDTARDQVTATWKQDSAKDRAAFLGCFSVGLSLADEAFLNSALSDRSKEVRTTAIELLSILTGSQFSQQIALLATEHVQLETSRGKLKLRVLLPDPADPKWQQWGLDVLRPIKDLFTDRSINDDKYAKLGDRALLLMHLLALAPLSIWSEKAMPLELLTAATQHEWELALTHGWLLAAQRQANLEWSQALLIWAAKMTSNAKRWLKLPGTALGQLLKQHPPDFQQDWILQWLQPDTWGTEKLHLLNEVSGPWPLALSRAILETAQQYLASQEDVKQNTRSQAYWNVQYPLRNMAFSLHPDTVDLAIESFKSNYSHLQSRDFDLVWQVLKFRQQMHRAITTPSALKD